MIDHVFLVTTNEMKFENAQYVLKKYGVSVEQVKMDVPEVQSADITQVAAYSAKYAGERLNAATLKIDVAFEIRTLGGFPGPFVKYINQWLSPEKILCLMAPEEDRYAQFVDAVSFFAPGHECVSFLSTTPGQISRTVEGENGWGIDKIFVPDGYSKTLASMTDEQKREVWNHSHWDQLGLYLQSAT